MSQKFKLKSTFLKKMSSLLPTVWLLIQAFIRAVWGEYESFETD